MIWIILFFLIHIDVRSKINTYVINIDNFFEVLKIFQWFLNRDPIKQSNLDRVITQFHSLIVYYFYMPSIIYISSLWLESKALSWVSIHSIISLIQFPSFLAICQDFSHIYCHLNFRQSNQWFFNRIYLKLISECLIFSDVFKVLYIIFTPSCPSTFAILYILSHTNCRNSNFSSTIIQMSTINCARTDSSHRLQHVSV